MYIFNLLIISVVAVVAQYMFHHCEAARCSIWICGKNNPWSALEMFSLWPDGKSITSVARHWNNERMLGLVFVRKKLTFFFTCLSYCVLLNVGSTVSYCTIHRSSVMYCRGEVIEDFHVYSNVFSGHFPQGLLTLSLFYLFMMFILQVLHLRRSQNSNFSGYQIHIFCIFLTNKKIFLLNYHWINRKANFINPSSTITLLP